MPLLMRKGFSSILELLGFNSYVSVDDYILLMTIENFQLSIGSYIYIIMTDHLVYVGRSKSIYWSLTTREYTLKEHLYTNIILPDEKPMVQ